MSAGDSATTSVTPAGAQFPIFKKDELTAELRQGEIITDLVQYFYDPVTKDVEALPHSYAVALNQDCDLVQDYNARNGQGASLITSVLFYIASPTVEVRTRANIRGDLWKGVIQNNHVRYHLLSAVAADSDLEGVGFPSLIIDFKSFFTLRPEDVYRQIKDGSAKRRCRLEMPYREHLQCRAAFYLQRVMLPLAHDPE